MGDWPSRTGLYWNKRFSRRNQGFVVRVVMSIGLIAMIAMLLSTYNCMLCSTKFLYNTDNKVIMKHDRSFHPVFSGQKEHASFLNACISLSCKTTACFCLLLFRDGTRPACRRQFVIDCTERTTERQAAVLKPRSEGTVWGPG